MNVLVILAQIRERWASTDGSFQERWLRAQQDILILLATIGAARGFHKEVPGRPWPTCSTCADNYGDPAEWPCEEYQAITRAIAGKQREAGGT